MRLRTEPESGTYPGLRSARGQSEEEPRGQGPQGPLSKTKKSAVLGPFFWLGSRLHFYFLIFTISFYFILPLRGGGTAPMLPPQDTFLVRVGQILLTPALTPSLAITAEFDQLRSRLRLQLRSPAASYSSISLNPTVYSPVTGQKMPQSHPKRPAFCESSRPPAAAKSLATAKA